MTALRSLSARLAVLLLAAQVAGFVMTLLGSEVMAIMGLLPWDENWNDLAWQRPGRLVAQSLVRIDDGSIRLAPTPALHAYIRSVPTFQFAAFDPKTRQALPGSSPELVAVLGADERVEVGEMTFRLATGQGAKLPGIIETFSTEFGRFRLALYGYQFHWDDLIYWAYRRSTEEVPFYLPDFLVAVVIGWVSIRYGMTPLKRVSQKATRIDFDTPDRRLPTADVPSEILPLVNSMNEALERLDEGIERERRFIANAAHELRTPIAILRARIDALAPAVSKTELQSDARHVQNIVEQLLTTARLAEQPSFASEEVDLSATIRDVVTDYAPLVIKIGRNIEFEAEDAPIMARASFHAIKSIVGNLIDNALRAEPPGGSIVVRVTKDAVIEVIDHGEGVAEGDRKMIFEPFWRKSERTPGTGLGLAIARELAARQGGRIWVEETLGGGATFRLSIPQLENADRLPARDCAPTRQPSSHVEISTT